MNLSDLYAKEGMEGLRALAARVGCSALFLYQIASGLRYPSPGMGWRIAAAEPRIRFVDLYERAKPDGKGLRRKSATPAPRRTKR